jgi:hypothetical protein
MKRARELIVKMEEGKGVEIQTVGDVKNENVFEQEFKKEGYRFIHRYTWDIKPTVDVFEYEKEGDTKNKRYYCVAADNE